MKFSWSDLFGSHETEIGDEPIWRIRPIAEGADVVFSLQDGTPPTLMIKIMNKSGTAYSILIMNIAALDEHIATLIKHRDLLAQMDKKE